MLVANVAANVAANTSSDDSPTARQAQSEYERNVEAQRQEYARKVEAARKDFEAKLGTARRAYLARLKAAQAEETRKKRPEAALAVKEAMAELESEVTVEWPLIWPDVDAADADAPAAGDPAAGKPPVAAAKKAGPQVYLFQDERTIRSDWNISGKDWRLEGEGLRLLNNKTEIVSKREFENDVQIQIAYRMVGGSEIWAEIWGERIEVGDDKMDYDANRKAVAKLERRGDTVTYSFDGGQQHLIKLKAEEAGRPSPLKLFVDRRNIGRWKTEAVLLGVDVKPVGKAGARGRR